jgi:hypothetical protein
VLRELLNLETSVAARRLRQSALNTDGGWLKVVDAKIATLRS